MSRRRGTELIYLSTVLLPLLAFMSLAVDVGRVQTAKTQLRSAADAAARAGSMGISDGTASTKAIAIAARNSVDGTPLILQNADVQLGYWDTSAKTFTAGKTPNNAICVTAKRVASRGTSIPLLLARVVGVFTCDITTYATVYSTQLKPNIFLTSISMNASSNIDSYNSSLGAYSPGTALSNGDVETNGNISLQTSAVIHGDALPGIGNSVSTGGASFVTGSTTPLTTTLTLGPCPTLTGSPTELGTFTKNGTGTYTLTAGTYHATSVNIGGSYQLNVSGKVTLYVDGAFTMNSTSTMPIGSTPSDFKIYLTGNANMNLGGNINLYANIYGPSINATINSSAQLYGTLSADVLNMSGSGQFHVDETGSGGGRQLVQ